MSKAQRFYKLVGAELVVVRGNAVQVSVVLHGPGGARSARIWFPLAHFRNYGPGKLFAAEWVIGKKNTELRQAGEKDTIRIDPADSFFQESS